MSEFNEQDPMKIKQIAVLSTVINGTTYHTFPISSLLITIDQLKEEFPADESLNVFKNYMTDLVMDTEVKLLQAELGMTKTSEGDPNENYGKHT